MDTICTSTIFVSSSATRRSVISYSASTSATPNSCEMDLICRTISAMRPVRSDTPSDSLVPRSLSIWAALDLKSLT